MITGDLFTEEAEGSVTIGGRWNHSFLDRDEGNGGKSADLLNRRQLKKYIIENKFYNVDFDNSTL